MYPKINQEKTEKVQKSHKKIISIRKKQNTIVDTENVTNEENNKNENESFQEELQRLITENAKYEENTQEGLKREIPASNEQFHEETELEFEEAIKNSQNEKDESALETEGDDFENVYSKQNEDETNSYFTEDNDVPNIVGESLENFGENEQIEILEESNEEKQDYAEVDIDAEDNQHYENKGHYEEVIRGSITMGSEEDGYEANLIENEDLYEPGQEDQEPLEIVEESNEEKQEYEEVDIDAENEQDYEDEGHYEETARGNITLGSEEDESEVHQLENEDVFEQDQEHGEISEESSEQKTDNEGVNIDVGDKQAYEDKEGHYEEVMEGSYILGSEEDESEVKQIESEDIYDQESEFMDDINQNDDDNWQEVETNNEEELLVA